ncbi:MAG: hypothetical protein L0154_18805 [Chloroflexi bacterium]|nr:hypothetical protein [Chloroflexota bacterium]
MSDNRLIAILVVATLLFGAVWLYYGVLDTEDPLEEIKTVEFSNMSIEVPENWEVQTPEAPNPRLIVSSEDVFTYDPWQTIISRDALANPETLYLNTAYSLAFNVDGVASYIILQPVPQEVQYLIDPMVTSVEEYYLPENTPEGQEAEVTRETLAIGDSILFSALEVNLKGDRIWQGSDTLFVAMYISQILNNEQYYLFTMVVVDENDEQRGKAWKDRAREFLDTVEFPQTTETPVAE